MVHKRSRYDELDTTSHLGNGLESVRAFAKEEKYSDPYHMGYSTINTSDLAGTVEAYILDEEYVDTHAA